MHGIPAIRNQINKPNNNTILENKSNHIHTQKKKKKNTLPLRECHGNGC